MIENAKLLTCGFVKIIDKTTRELLVDTTNDILYGNISAAFAHSLIGNPSMKLFYLGFGNGAAYVGTTGSIAYKQSLGGTAGLIKQPTANLYNTVYVKQLTNDSSLSQNVLSQAYIGTENYATNYEDIIINVNLDYTEPPTGIISSSNIQQTTIDNSTFVGSPSTAVTTDFNPNTLVFNEIGLFSGTPNIFTGDHTSTTTDVSTFVGTSTTFSPTAGTASKLMLTHAIFHPVQKSANRALEIVYTLRVQMGI